MPPKDAAAAEGRNLWRHAALLRRWPVILSAVAALVAVGLWFLFDDRPGEVPFFAADTGPYKRVPEASERALADEVSNTGIFVLGSASPEADRDGHEVLLPPPEEPVDLRQEAGETADTGDADAGQDAVVVSEAPVASGVVDDPGGALLNAEQVAALAEPYVSAAPAAPSDVPLPARKPFAPTRRVVQEEESAAPAEDAQGLSFADVAAALGSPGEGLRVQLASFSQRERALQSWKHLHGEHRDLLGQREAVFVETVVADKTFYRLQIGDFAHQGDADALCVALKARDVDCFVVAP